MKIELSPTEAAILLDIIQSMQSVKPEAPKVSSWEPKAEDTVLVSDDGETWHRRIFKRLNENGEAIAVGPRDRAYSWEFMMPFDKNSIR